MLKRLVPVAGVLLALVSAPCAAAEPDYASAEPLFAGSKSVVGETIAYPTTGPAHIESLIVSLKPGEATVAHRHGAPIWCHILEGQVSVDYGENGVRAYRKGDQFLEALSVGHVATTDGDLPVRTPVVFRGPGGTAK